MFAVFECFWMRILLFFVLAVDVNADSHIKKIIDGAMEVLSASQRGTTIRQCSCDEDAECVKVMQIQAVECANKCWRIFGQITDDPQSLYTCMAKKMPAVSVFIRCISEHIQSCVPERTGPQIPQVDLRRMFDIGEQRVHEARAQVLKSIAIEGIKAVAEAAMNFGACVKKCFVEEKNGDGFCYERKSCQPLITEQNLRRSLRSCLASASWKNHAAELCDCAEHAGVRGIKDICSVLRAARG